MAVYVVYRSHYDDPSGKRLKRFDDSTVLDWFRNHWQHLCHSEEAAARLHELLGFSIYGFSSIFSRAAEEGLPPPESDEDLGDYLDEHLYSEGPIFYDSHLLTVQTDDDELEVAYYVFDDHYLARHGKLAAYLLNDGWRLPSKYAEDWFFEPGEPTEARTPAGPGEGATYFACFAFEDSCNLTDLGSTTRRIDGVRIPDLARYLLTLQPTIDAHGFSDLDGHLPLLRAQLLTIPATNEPVEQEFYQAILDNPHDEASWRACLDFLHEQTGRPGSLVILENALRAVTHLPVHDLPHEAWQAAQRGSVLEAHKDVEAALTAHPPDRPDRHDPSKSRIQVDEHVAVLYLHVGRLYEQTDLYYQWILFDDQWAAAHPDLANAIMRYDRCWDVLCPDGPRDQE
jgi:hypothetical protein